MNFSPYYFPQSYQPYQQNYQYQNMQPVQAVQQQSPTTQQQTSGIIWVQGIEGAKSYPVQAGTTALLMDSEELVLYIKSVNQSGMPMPLEIYDLMKRNNQQTAHTANQQEVIPDLSGYVTKEELQTAIAELSRKMISEKQNLNKENVENA